MDIARHLPLSQSDRSADADLPDRRMLAAELVLSVGTADPSDEEAARFLQTAGAKVPSLGALADALHAAKRVSASTFLATVRAALEFSDARGATPAPDARTLGMAALLASAKAPADRRAAISGLTVTATDAGWSIGRGPVAAAPAVDIVRFLLGLSDVPPKPARG